jgi:hypothetical protein
MLAGASLLGASTIQVERTNTQNYPDEVQIKSVPIEGAGLMRLGGLLFCGAGLAIAQPLLNKEEAQAQAATASLPSQQSSSQSAIATSTQQWDEDPEIELDEKSTQQEEKPKTQAPIAASLFDRMYSNHKRHLLIPAETGAGKTTLLLGAIEYGHSLFDGQIEFFGSTAKRSPYLGLEDQVAEDGKSRIIFIDPTEPSTIQPLLDRLRWLRKRLGKRGELREAAEKQGKTCNFKRNIIVLDEWNETLEVAKEFDRQYNLSIEKGEPRSDAHGDLLGFINSFARTGREDEMAIWAFAQDHQVQNAGINTGYRKNFAILVPAKYGSMMGLEDALTGRSPIVSSVAKGREILVRAESVAKANPKVAIAYSNIEGHEILAVPYLPDIKRKRIFSATTKNNVTPIRREQAIAQSQPTELDDPWSTTA